ncbi:MAG: hypothetical protein JWN05_278 [Arthrobacter sp.]|jgi:hypothetical protein|nr:hypothetical protein [Arthrobacter sp.]
MPRPITLGVGNGAFLFSRALAGPEDVLLRYVRGGAVRGLTDGAAGRDGGAR